MSRDELLGGDDIDAFVMGATDENGMRRDGELGERARRGLKAVNDTRVTSASSNTPPIAPSPRFGPLSAHLNAIEEQA